MILVDFNGAPNNPLQASAGGRVLMVTGGAVPAPPERERWATCPPSLMSGSALVAGSVRGATAQDVSAARRL
jgi:hypothetical protein